MVAWLMTKVAALLTFSLSAWKACGWDWSKESELDRFAKILLVTVYQLYP